MRGKETVTLLRSSVTEPDPYGDPPESTITRIDIEHCLVAPTSSTEPTNRGRAGVVTGWAVYPPQSAPAALFTDGIEIRGVVCRIEGEVGDWGLAGSVINAVRAVG